MSAVRRGHGWHGWLRTGCRQSLPPRLAITETFAAEPTQRHPFERQGSRSRAGNRPGRKKRHTLGPIPTLTLQDGRADR